MFRLSSTRILLSQPRLPAQVALDEVLCQESIMTLGVVPLARYATAGTDEVGASLSPHIATHDAILLANHGAVTCGRSLLDAFMKMETIEHLAQVALVAHQLGSASRYAALRSKDCIERENRM